MPQKKKQPISPETTTLTASRTPSKASAKHPAPEVATPHAATTPASMSAAQKAQSTPDGTHPSSGTAAGAFTVPAPSGSPSATPPATTAAPTPATSTVDIAGDPPAVTFPAALAGFVPGRLRKLVTYRMSTEQYGLMALVATSLANGAALKAALGPYTPDLGAISEEITRAIAWRMLRSQAELFAAYVKQGDATAWNQVFASIAQLKVLYNAALPLNAAVKTAAPALTQLFGAQAATGARISAARKKNAKTHLVALTAAAQAATGGVTTTAPAKSKS
jgi:hypothetical protein